MEDFIQNLRAGSSIEAPEGCIDAFYRNFPDASGIEWHKTGEDFEVLFYRSNIEHIAIFSTAGILLEYKKTLDPEHLPGNIRNSAGSKGEIMNYVLINRGNQIEYQLIIRDKALNRYLLGYSETGDELYQKNL